MMIVPKAPIKNLSDDFFVKRKIKPYAYATKQKDKPNQQADQLVDPLRGPQGGVAYFDRTQFTPVHASWDELKQQNVPIPFAIARLSPNCKRGWTNRYASLTPSQIEEYMREVPAEQRTLQPIILGSHPVSLYMDIDASVDDADKEKSEWAKELLEDPEEFSKFCTDYIPDFIIGLLLDFDPNMEYEHRTQLEDELSAAVQKYLIVYNASTKTKVSLHVHCSGIVFPSSECLCEYMKWAVKRSGQKFMNCIDMQVYDNYRNFRMYGQTKPGKGNNLKFYSSGWASKEEEIPDRLLQKFSEGDLILETLPSYSCKKDAVYMKPELFTCIKIAKEKAEKARIAAALLATKGTVDVQVNNKKRARPENETKQKQQQLAHFNFDAKLNYRWINKALEALRKKNQNESLIRGFYKLGVANSKLEEWTGLGADQLKQIVEKPLVVGDSAALEALKTYAGTEFEVEQDQNDKQTFHVKQSPAATPIFDVEQDKSDKLKFHLKRKQESTCVIHKKEHESWDQYAYILPNGDLCVYCYKDGHAAKSKHVVAKVELSNIADLSSIMTLMRYELGDKIYCELAKTNPIYESEIEKLLLSGEAGLAQIVANEAKGTIKFSGEDPVNPHPYFWDCEAKLWRARNAKTLGNDIEPMLKKYIVEYRDRADIAYLKSTYMIGDEGGKKTKNIGEPFFFEKAKKLSDLETAIGTSYTQFNIATQLQNKLIDPTFFYDLDNSNPHLIPFKGGQVFDCKTKEVRDRVITDLFTKEMPATYIKMQNDYKNAKNFLLDFCGRTKNMTPVEMKSVEELEAFLRMILGYCLTGCNLIKRMFIFWGDGNNGKSSLWKIMFAMMGDFAYAGNHALITTSPAAKGNEHSQHKLVMLGRRLINCAELPPHKKYGAGEIKPIVSGGKDPVPARKINGGNMSFICRAKFAINCNKHVPKDDDSDEAMDKRLLVFPCLASFLECKQNSEHVNAMETTNLNELFSYLVDGAALYYERGCDIDALGPIPAACNRARQDYEKATGSVGKFISQKCTTAPFPTIGGEEKEPAHISRDELWVRYKNWCTEELKWDRLKEAQVIKEKTQFRKKLELAVDIGKKDKQFDEYKLNAKGEMVRVMNDGKPKRIWHYQGVRLLVPEDEEEVIQDDENPIDVLQAREATVILPEGATNN